MPPLTATTSSRTLAVATQATPLPARALSLRCRPRSQPCGTPPFTTSPFTRAPKASAKAAPATRRASTATRPTCSSRPTLRTRGRCSPSTQQPALLHGQHLRDMCTRRSIFSSSTTTPLRSCVKFSRQPCRATRRAQWRAKRSASGALASATPKTRTLGQAPKGARRRSGRPAAILAHTFSSSLPSLHARALAAAASRPMPCHRRLQTLQANGHLGAAQSSETEDGQDGGVSALRLLARRTKTKTRRKKTAEKHQRTRSPSTVARLPRRPTSLGTTPSPAPSKTKLTGSSRTMPRKLRL